MSGSMKARKFRRRTVVTGFLGSAVTAGMPTLASLWANAAYGEDIPPGKDSEDAPYDLVIVGAGAAGMAAAIAARDAGATRVVILEKSALVGGHMIVSNGMLNALDPEGQRRMGRTDSAEAFFRDTWERGEKRGNPELIHRMVDESTETMQWLERLGVVFERRLFEAYTGVSPRAHRTLWERSGFEYTRRLMDRVRQLKVELKYRHRVIRLLQEEGAVVGVFAEDASGMVKLFRASAVVLATGGFGANEEMRATWTPELPPSLGTTYSLNRQDEDPATGDGIRMGLLAGAAVTGMQHVVAIPFWGGRVLDYPGAEMFLTLSGERFTDETASWNRIFDDLAKTGSGQFWVITDGRSIKGATFATKAQQGRIQSAGSIEELARRMNMDEKVLKASIARYNAAAHSGNDPEFGRTRFLQDLSTPPFFFGRERFEVHYTCGGLVIDRDGRVMRRVDANEGSAATHYAIPGLYAAGETTGGVHGAFRLGGNGLLDAFVFGRAAGRAATRDWCPEGVSKATP